MLVRHGVLGDQVGHVQVVEEDHLAEVQEVVGLVLVVVELVVREKAIVLDLSVVPEPRRLPREAAIDRAPFCVWPSLGPASLSGLPKPRED